ncbi:MAG TPA: hypothetical protein VEZ15_14055 [Acidimicrobiia bacterium]|nr:hypothetical protein [Acidimicrobiia bacterium]
MNRTTVKQLAQVHGRPAVSILCPLDTRRPGNAHDPAVLSHLRNEAVEQVEGLVQGHAATLLIDRIDMALASVDLHHPSRGIAVLVSPSLSRVFSLDIPIEPHVVVGERFAVRDLVTAMLRMPRSRIVVLSKDKSRCIDVTGDAAVEQLGFGFPVEVVAPTEADTPHRDFPLGEHEHAEAVKFVFRVVDRALVAVEHHDPRPLVLVGAERDLAYFDEVSLRRAHVVARVHGNHERDTARELAKLVRPALEAYEREQQQAACDEAREAIGTHAVSGLADTWLAARAGRGHRLILEDGYQAAARIAGETFEAASDGDAGSFDAVADTVQEVVRHDGEILVVPAGSLADLGHIALVTRY